jgi:hypothetical protein
MAYSRHDRNSQENEKQQIKNKNKKQMEVERSRNEARLKNETKKNEGWPVVVLIATLELFIR